MKKYTVPQIKLGATSFLLHAGYVPAVRFTAERCEDVALLLTETGKRDEYLITPAEVRELSGIIAGEGASLHVHLPTDADFDTPQGARAMVAKVRKVAERTARLCPHSFVLHVDFPSLHKASPAARTAARLPRDRFQRTAEALREIAACLPAPGQLALENLPAFPAQFWDGWIDGSSYSRCLDVGHIWKDGGDPASVLTSWLPRVRVIHLHGLEPSGCLSSAERPASAAFSCCGSRLRDHRSLRFMPADCLDGVLHPLWQNGFPGVLTLEVFSFADFVGSHAAILESYARYERWCEQKAAAPHASPEAGARP